MTNLEHQLAQAALQPQLLAGSPSADEPARVAESLFAIHAELDAPRESRLARLLRRLGVPDLAVPLVTATPALRRSWFVAVAIAVLFALSTVSNNTGAGVDRIAVFLTLAPLIPLVGVALAFGKGVDPTHDLVLAAPRDTFTVFLLRALTVLAASSLVLVVTSLFLPTGGFFRFSWLLPGLALSASALAASARFDARRSAAVLGSAWVVGVIVITGARSVAAMFGPAAQAISVAITIGAAVFVLRTRARFDPVGGTR